MNLSRFGKLFEPSKTKHSNGCIAIIYCNTHRLKAMNASTKLCARQYGAGQIWSRVCLICADHNCLPPCITNFCRQPQCQPLLSVCFIVGMMTHLLLILTLFADKKPSGVNRCPGPPKTLRHPALPHLLILPVVGLGILRLPGPGGIFKYT